MIEALLPLKGITITLRFATQGNPSFFHQPALRGFLSNLPGVRDTLHRMATGLLGKEKLGGKAPFDLFLFLDVPESGRTCYRPGDFYRFDLYGLPGSDEILDVILLALRQLPKGFPDLEGEQPPFRDNLRWASAHCRFSQQPAVAARDLRPYGFESLVEEVRGLPWREETPWLSLRWRSPVRIMREKGEGAARPDRRQATERGFCRDSGDLPADLFLTQIQRTLASMLRNRGSGSPQEQLISTGGSLQGDLFWVDFHYIDKPDHKGRRRERVMGGMVGDFQLEVPKGWLGHLVLAQHLGLGQNRAMGYGRFQLQGGHPGTSSALPMLQQTLDAPLLLEAHRHLDPEATQRLDLDRLLGSLRDGTYEPSPLTGYLAPRPDGNWRPLAVPSMADRILQRAVAQRLSPILEPLFSGSSFAYRKGKSRLDARYSLEHLRKEGYAFILEGDIQAFFDQVDWVRLERRLRALWGDDPMVDLIMRWVQAPVNIHGTQVNRASGLPQGAPISPILANLFLDDFDGDLECRGFKVIRFADDFVVACRNREETLEALEVVRASIQEKGLSLKDEKTRITHFDDGFRFLGYLFHRGLVLESPRYEQELPIDSRPMPPTGWLKDLEIQDPQIFQKVLAQVAKRKGCPSPSPAPQKVEPAIPPPECAAKATAPSPSQGTAAIHMPHPHGEGLKLLIVTRDRCRLRLEQGRILVDHQETELASTPMAHLDAILLFGPHSISGPLLQACLQAGLPVHHAEPRGDYLGCTASGDPSPLGASFWKDQQRAFNNPGFALTLARALVHERLHQATETLRNRDTPSPAIKAIITALPQASTLETLRGLEGQGTHHYFQALQALVPPWAGFKGRNRRPPLDPFNALLSYGYSVIYAHIGTLLRAHGLHPWTGFYHQGRGRHMALASDLVESFRHLVDRTALTLMRRRTLDDSHFDVSDGACWLEPEARRIYLAALLGMIQGQDGSPGILGDISNRAQGLIQQVRAASDTTTTLQHPRRSGFEEREGVSEAGPPDPLAPGTAQGEESLPWADER